MFAHLTERLSNALRHISSRSRFTEENIQQTLREVRMALLEADVALPVVRDFIQRIKGQVLGEQVDKSLTPGQAFIKIVQRELEVAMGGTNHELDLKTQPPAIVLMVGLQGAGKTTTVAKLGQFLHRHKKKKVLLTSTDIYRPAALQQLQVLADALAIDCFIGEPQDKPLAIADKARQYAQLKFYDVLIVDTAGRLHVDAPLMEEIQQLQQALKPIETLFVVDAMTGQDAANTAKAFNDLLPLTGIILSKADGDTRGGAALSMRHLTGKPIKFLGMGEKSDALEPFYPDRMASRILGMGDMLSLIEEIEQKRDNQENERLVKKFTQGALFDFEDFRDQLKQMRNMGGMMGLLNKLPGAHQLPQHLKSQMDDKALIRMEAIINSMTHKERQVKDVIKSSRKRRIAAGAGVQVQEVNRLLKQFEDMQQMMKKMRHGGITKMMRGLKGMLPPGFGGH